MLFDKIVELRTPLRHTSDEDAARALRRQIQNLETQLLVSFESTGRPLLAQLVAEKPQEEARREEKGLREACTPPAPTGEESVSETLSLNRLLGLTYK